MKPGPQTSHLSILSSYFEKESCARRISYLCFIPYIISTYTRVTQLVSYPTQLTRTHCFFVLCLYLSDRGNYTCELFIEMIHTHLLFLWISMMPSKKVPTYVIPMEFNSALDDLCFNI